MKILKHKMTNIIIFRDASECCEQIVNSQRAFFDQLIKLFQNNILAIISLHRQSHAFLNEIIDKYEVRKKKPNLT